MHQVVITLEEADLLALNEVLIDEDPEGALAFLREHIVPKVPQKGNAPCDSSRRNPYLFGRGISKKLAND